MASKTCFQLVKKVLDELRAEIIKLTGTDAAADEAIAEQVKHLSYCYNNITKPSISTISLPTHLFTRSLVFLFIAWWRMPSKSNTATATSSR